MAIKKPSQSKRGGEPTDNVPSGATLAMLQGRVAELESSVHQLNQLIEKTRLGPPVVMQLGLRGGIFADTRPTPKPEVDGPKKDSPFPAGTPPPPPGWSRVPLHPAGQNKGKPNWPPTPGRPGGKWNPLTPESGPRGRKITYDPDTNKLRIHCGGGVYDVDWGSLCSDTKPAAAPAPSGLCSPAGKTQDQRDIGAAGDREIYIEETDCNVQITCVVPYPVTTTTWTCTDLSVPNSPGNIRWKAGASVQTTEYSVKSTIFDCC